MKNKKIILNIKELALLKTNPKEFYAKKLKKDLDEMTIKHPVTEYARRIGSKGVWGPITITKDGRARYSKTYKDGTKITFETSSKKIKTSEVVHIKTPDGVKTKDEILEELHENPPEDFESYETIAEYFDGQPESIIKDEYESQFKDEADKLYNAQFEDVIRDQLGREDGSFVISGKPVGTGTEWMVPIDNITYKTRSDGSIVEITTPDGEKIQINKGFFDNVFPNNTDNHEIGDVMTELKKDESADYKNMVRIATELSEDEVGYVSGHSYMFGSHKRLLENVANGVPTEDMPNLKNVSPEYREFAENRLTDIINNNHIPDETPTFASYKIHVGDLPEGQGVNKAIVRNNGFKAGTITTPVPFKGTHSEKDNWTIITVHNQGNPARNGVIGGMGSHRGIATGPNQKNERRIIDEEDKIILQYPYEAGMPRHIYG